MAASAHPIAAAARQSEARAGCQVVIRVQVEPPKRASLNTLGFMALGSNAEVALTIEEVRKHARILVIDDHVFPAEKTFTRDGYHVERWPYIKNLSQLTDGHYQLILLDVQGVGLAESPDKQGLGILEHVKKTNPAQAVILYSSDTY